MKNKSIDAMTSAVFDNGRRGMPRPGCDCVQCFGYCMIDPDEALRARLTPLGASGKLFGLGDSEDSDAIP